MQTIGQFFILSIIACTASSMYAWPNNPYGKRMAEELLENIQSRMRMTEVELPEEDLSDDDYDNNQYTDEYDSEHPRTFSRAIIVQGHALRRTAQSFSVPLNVRSREITHLSPLPHDHDEESYESPYDSHDETASDQSTSETE